MNRASSKAKRNSIATLRRDGELRDLKILEEDIKKARLALKKVKSAGTSVESLHLLRSYFNTKPK